METISAYGEIAEELKRQVRGYKFENRLSDAGRVVACGDGVLTVEGLPNVKNGELLYIGRDKYALAMNLEEYKIGAILLADSYELSEGDIAYSTGKIVGVPVGDALWGASSIPWVSRSTAESRLRAKNTVRWKRPPPPFSTVQTSTAPCLRASRRSTA